ncbi:MAG: hypothetical protein ACTHLR_17605 [Rhizomicrobium sp.]
MTINFSHGKKRFEVRREIANGEAIYVGYVDGTRSVTGPRAHIAARVLYEKHVVGAPEAVVFRFPSERRCDGKKRTFTKPRT